MSSISYKTIEDSGNGQETNINDTHQGKSDSKMLLKLKPNI